MHEAGAVNDDNRTTSSQSVTGQRYSQHPQFTLPTLKETEMYEPKSNSNSQNGHDSNLQQQILGSRSPRVIHWFTFFLISIIVLGSSMEAVSQKSIVITIALFGNYTLTYFHSCCDFFYNSYTNMLNQIISLLYHHNLTKSTIKCQTSLNKS